MEEQRKTARTVIDILINYHRKIQVHARDISENGIRIRTEQSFRIKEFLTLSLSFPENPEIRAVAKVIWCNKLDSGIYETGLEFWDINPSEKDIVNKYITDRCREKRDYGYEGNNAR